MRSSSTDSLSSSLSGTGGAGPSTSNTINNNDNNDNNSKKQSVLVQLATLKKEVELASLRIQSTEVQWKRDRKAMFKEKEKLLSTLKQVSNKLIIAEGKRRFNHQGELIYLSIYLSIIYIYVYIYIYSNVDICGYY